MLVQAFDTVINWAFTAMLLIYGAVAGLGYFYFGDAASTLITDDLANNSPFTGRSVIPFLQGMFLLVGNLTSSLARAHVRCYTEA